MILAPLWKPATTTSRRCSSYEAGPVAVRCIGRTTALDDDGQRRAPVRAFVLDRAHAAGAPESFIVRAAGEFAHLHPAYDGSMHVTLPQHYAADVIAKGWGVTASLDEAHAFAAGRRGA